MKRYILIHILGLGALSGGCQVQKEPRQQQRAGSASNKRDDNTPQATSGRSGSAPSAWTHRRLESPGGPVLQAVAISFDEQLVATGSATGEITLWEAFSGRQLARWSTSLASVTTLVFSPNGRVLASGGPAPRSGQTATLQLWEVLKRRLLRPLQCHDAVKKVLYAPDGHCLYAAGQVRGAAPSGAVQSGAWRLTIWDAITGTLLQKWPAPKEGLAVLARSRDGSYLAGAGPSGAIHLWQRSTGQKLRVLSGTTPVQGLAFSPRGNKLLASGQDGAITLWNIAAGQAWSVIATGDARLGPVAFSPDGRSFFAAGRELRRWDVARGQPREMLGRSSSAYRALDVSPTGRLVAAISADGACTIWRQR